MYSTNKGEAALARQEDMTLNDRHHKEKEANEVDNTKSNYMTYMGARIGSLPSLTDTIEEEEALREHTKTQIYEKLKEFSLETTGHGLPRIIEAENYYMKFLWLICYLAAIVLCIIMMTRNITQYLSWGVSSQILVVSEPNITFPVITMCNVNPFVTLAGNEYLRNYYNTKYNLSLQTYADFYEAVSQGTNGIQDETNWVLYQTYAHGFNSTLMQSLGYDVDTMFMNCQFADLPCYTSSFQWYYHPQYGNCFRFNSLVDTNGNSVPPAVVTVQGTGFYIELFAGLPDVYYPYFYETPNRGLVVLVENQNNYPLWGKVGVFVNLASYTKMVISHTDYQKLSTPYSDCPDLTTLNTSLSYELTQRLGMQYSRTNCMILCEQKQVIDQLGCYDQRYPSIFNARPCSTQAEFNAIENLVTNLTECSTLCPYECYTEEFDLSISYTDYPSWDYYYKELNSNADFYTQLFNRSIDQISYDMYSSSVASLFLYYDDLVDTQITESPALTLVTLVSNIGGILGLFMGVSILSFVEFIELSVTFLMLVYHERKNRIKREEKRETKDGGQHRRFGRRADGDIKNDDSFI